MRKTSTKPKPDMIVEYLKEHYRGCKIIILKSHHVCFIYNQQGYVVQYIPKIRTSYWYKYGVNNTKNIVCLQGGMDANTLIKQVNAGQAWLI